MNWEEIAELKVIYVQPPTGSNSVIASRKADPYDYVVSVNERRRHLTTTQCSEVAAKLLKARPDLSDRAIAKTAQVDHLPCLGRVGSGGDVGGMRSAGRASHRDSPPDDSPCGSHIAAACCPTAAGRAGATGRARRPSSRTPVTCGRAALFNGDRSAGIPR